MPIFIAHVGHDYDLAQNLAQRLEARNYDVLPRMPMPPYVPAEDNINNRTKVYMLIWSPNSVKNGDMIYAAGVAGAAADLRKRLSVRMRSADSADLPANAGPRSEILLFEDTDAIVAALGDRCMKAIEKAEPSPWGPVLLIASLIGLLLLFFAYLSFPPRSDCREMRGYDDGCGKEMTDRLPAGKP